MTAIYVTVEHCGGSPAAARPPCQGCTPATPSSAVEERLAAFKIIGASGVLALCRDCAVHSIKSLAARFVMFDRGATQDLMDFFAAEAAGPRRNARGRRSRGRVIDAATSPRLLEEGRKKI